MRIGASLGDPRGIGPEVAAAAAARLRVELPHARIVFVGPGDSPARLAADEFVPSGGSATADGDAAAGATAARAIEMAAGLALAGEIDALVTAPIDKHALNAAGWHFPGHTEMLAAAAGAVDVVMMLAADRTLAGGPLRVTFATTHIRLADVARTLDARTLVARTHATATGLTTFWGIERPRIALCALNPHASDGGLFGDEEARVYAPALDELKLLGIDVHGPVPADTVFVRAVRGEFDAVVAPYHDVGMAAFKTAAFGHGVNVTLGLPFIRTSPDHGTAFDLAGTGRADAGSMLAAFRLAARMAERRASITADDPAA